MSFFGDLVGSFTGSTGRKSLDTSYNDSRNALNTAEGKAVDWTQKGYDQSQGYLDPYAQQGNRAQTMYSNALGINGGDAQNQFYSQYQASPMMAYLQKQAAQRSAAQGGGPSSGVYAAAQTRVGAENLNSYLQQLGGQAGMGGQVAGQQSQNALGHGNGMANIYGGFGQQRATNAINYGNASAQQSNVFGQNFIGAMSAAAKAAGTAAKAASGGGG